MKNFKLCLLICISMLTMFSSVAVNADSRANSLVVTLGSGYEYFASKRLLKNTNVNYVSLGYNFTCQLGLELMVGFFNSEFKPIANYVHHVNGNLFLLDAVYHFNAYKHFLEPFLLAGVGVTGISRNRTDANNEGNINAAIGVNLFLDKLVAIRLEARDLYTTVGGKNDVLISAGLSFFVDLC